MFSYLQKTARQVETAFFGLVSPNRDQRLAILNDDGPYRGRGVTVPGAPAQGTTCPAAWALLL